MQLHGCWTHVPRLNRWSTPSPPTHLQSLPTLWPPHRHTSRVSLALSLFAACISFPLSSLPSIFFCLSVFSSLFCQSFSLLHLYLFSTFVCRLHLRPYLETFALDFSLFKESQSLSLSSFLLLADFIHLSSPVLSLRDSCALSNRAFLRVIFETYRSLSVATVSLVSLLCERQEETEREEGKENLLYLLVSSFISIAIPPATYAQLYAISLCSFSIRST